MKTYNKLVRDFIPMILKNENKHFTTRVLQDDKEYENQLYNKMQEELNEYFESGDIMELVDLGEVMHALLELKGISIEHYQELRLKKLREKGSFKSRVFLVDVIENT